MMMVMMIVMFSCVTPCFSVFLQMHSSWCEFLCRVLLHPCVIVYRQFEMDIFCSLACF